MNYIDYLETKFDVDHLDFEAVQAVLEKEYQVRVASNEYKLITFELFLKMINSIHHEYILDHRLNYHYNYIYFGNAMTLYTIDIFDNKITKKELYYMLYILYGRYSYKFKKKDIDEILKQFD